MGCSPFQVIQAFSIRDLNALAVLVGAERGGELPSPTDCWAGIPRPKGRMPW
jgi:hypothetical protein